MALALLFNSSFWLRTPDATPLAGELRLPLRFFKKPPKNSSYAGTRNFSIRRLTRKMRENHVSPKGQDVLSKFPRLFPRLLEFFANVVGGVGAYGLVVFVGGGAELVCLWDRLRADGSEFFAPVASIIGSVRLSFALVLKSAKAEKLKLKTKKTKIQNQTNQKKENQSQAKQSQKTKRKRRKARRAQLYVASQRNCLKAHQPRDFEDFSKLYSQGRL